MLPRVKPAQAWPRMVSESQGTGIYRQGILIYGKLIIYGPGSLPERDEGLGGKKKWEGWQRRRGGGFHTIQRLWSGWTESPAVC